MSPEEKKEFADLIAASTVAALAQVRPSEENHGEEHAWVRARIEKERQRAEFYRKAGQTIFGTVIAAFLIWLAAKTGAFFQFVLRS